MLYNKFNNKIIYYINKFLYSTLFIIISVILMNISCLFGLEIPIYYIITFLVLIIILFSKDMLPITPLVSIGYMTFSTKNNPINNDNSFVYTSYFKINMIIIISILVITILTRLIYELIKNKNKTKPIFYKSIILLSIILVIGGLCSNYYDYQTIRYGLLVSLSLFFFYIVLHYTVKSENLKLDYFAKLFMYIGLGLVIQVIYMYISCNNTSDDFNRGLLKIGWGVYNNIAGVMCVCIPAGFYLIIKKKNYIPYIFITHIIFIATIFTQSRNGIVMSTLLFGLSTLLILIYKERKKFYTSMIVSSSILLIIGLIILFKYDLITNTFSSLFNIKSDDNGRFIQYKKGLKAFLNNPIFGTGFYDYDHGTTVYFKQGEFIPPRYHNTIIQFIASTGALGLVIYGYHRFETLKVIFKKITIEKVFIGLLISGLLLTSLLDCHLFNLGPGLHYSVLLLFLEKTNEINIY